MDKAKLKAEIEKELRAYLQENNVKIGSPNKQILQHLKPMWICLEQKGLIKKGMSFSVFSQIAIAKYREAELFDRIQNHFGGFGF